MRPARRAAPTLLLVGLLVAGCAGQGPEGGGGGGGPTGAPDVVVPDRPAATVRVGLGRDPISIDPRLIGDDEGELVVRALFDGLVDIAPTGAVVPAAATWVVDDDGLTYRFALREDRFHDGSPVTAQHHADAMLAVLDPDRPPFFREDLLAPLRGVPSGGSTGPDAPAEGDERLPGAVLAAGGIEVLDDRSLVLRLVRPDPLLLHRLADPVLVPLPALAHEDPARFATEPIGNGPFRMLGPREPGAFIRLQANRDHPQPPRIDDLVLQMYPEDVDRSLRWADLVAGRLQIAAVPVDRRDEARDRFGVPFEGRSGAGLHDLPLLSLYAYGFILDVPPYDDSDLRRAISAAIDREALALVLAAAGVEPATSLLPPALGGPLPECPHCRHDPELAAELVAMWRERLPEGMREPTVVLAYPRGGGHVAIAERIAGDLERTLGLDVRLQAQEFGAHVRSVQAGAAPLFRYGLRAPLGGSAAPTGMLEAALRADAPENLVRWNDPATDRLIAEWTPHGGMQVARAIEWQVLDSAAIVPLLWTRQDLVVDPVVLGFRSDATGRWWPERIHLR